MSNFANNNDDYGRKLYLIENCLYGVDIQPIAIQITKLRFFISLVCDQKTNRSKKDNHGIRPLPNLETKFVAADTLIGIPKKIVKEGHFDLTTDAIQHLQKKLQNVRHQYFTVQFRRDKLRLQKEDKDLRQKLAHELARSYAEQSDADTVEKLALWDPFDPQSTSGFFDAEWMFGNRLTQKFDIVIGNPPYGFHRIHSAKAKAYFKQNYVASQGSFEHYFLFYEAALRLLGKNGVLAFIAPVTWLTIPSANSLRRFILEDYSISEICWLSEQAFESASVNTLISIMTNRSEPITRIKFFELLSGFPSDPKKQIEIPQKRFIDAGYYISIFSGDEDNIVVEKIRQVSKPLTEFARPCSGYNPYEVGSGEAPEGGPHTKETVQEKPYHSNSKLGSQWKREIVGRDLHRYHVKLSGERWVKYGPWLSAPRSPENFQGKRILVQEITGGKDMRLVGAYHDGELYHSRDVIPIKLDKSDMDPAYLLAIVNSWLLTWYHQKCNPKAQKGLFPKVLVSDLKSLPIFPASKSQQSAIAKLSKRVLDAKLENPAADTSSLEREIDQLVYALYGLTPEEIAIVEGTGK